LPRYSGEFDITYDEIFEGCMQVLDFIISKNIDMLS